MINYFAQSTNMLLCPAARSPASPVFNAYGSPGNPTGGGQPGTAINNWVLYLTVNSPLGWTIPCSYTYNAWFYSPAAAGVNRDAIAIEASHGVSDPAWCFLKDSAIQQPTLTPVYADGNWQDACPTEVDSPGQDLLRGTDWLGQKNGYEMGRVAIQRHGSITSSSQSYKASWKTSPPSGAVNVTAYDGHAELTKLPKLWTWDWHRNWGQNQTPDIGLPVPY
jgi:hypothetical protein